MQPSSARMLGVAVLLCATNLLTAQDRHKYPLTKMEKVTDILHGHEFVDNYRWLEDGDSPAVKEWVEQQNKFTQDVLGKFPGREQIKQRLSKLLETGSLSTPVPKGMRLFFTKREGEQNQPILYVRDCETGEDRVLVDPNALAKDGTVALDWWYPSNDGTLVAYGTSKDGSEQSTLRVRLVATGDDLPDVIERTRYGSVAWLPDSTGFYYTRYPKIGSVSKGQENYNRHVFFHELGADPAKDAKVFGEGRAPEDMLSVDISPKGRYVAVTAAKGWAMTELYVMDRQSPKPKFVPLVEGIEAVFNVIPREDRFYIKTNHEAPRYRLFAVDPEQIARERWKLILPQQEDKLETVLVLRNRLVAQYMHKATSRLKTFALKPMGLSNPTEFNETLLRTITDLRGEADGNEYFCGFQSFTMPTVVYRESWDKNNRPQSPALWGRVKCEVQSDDYVVEQVVYPSKDGTKISMFLTYKKGIEKNGKNPTLLYGYGGFNISLTPMFAAGRFVFLEQGGVFAVPNLRGGGEYGEEWHRAGMLENKQNTFDDFIAAGQWLIKNGYTDKEHLAIQGGSNGGLLVGAAMTQRPDLFRAVVCQVPLLDMLRYHKFLIARLWIPEYGSADDPEQYKFIEKYSPYQKVKDGTEYPAVLLTTAAADSRVDPMHARKMAARLQAASISTRPILLRQETRAGHGAGKPRGMVLEEQVDLWTFLFSQLGIQ